MLYSPSVNVKNVHILREDDYSHEYYILSFIVTNNSNAFGEMDNNRCILNEHGDQAISLIERIIERYEHIDLIDYVIMPDHMHVVIDVNMQFYEVKKKSEEKLFYRALRKSLQHEFSLCKNCDEVIWQGKEMIEKITPTSLPDVLQYFESEHAKWYASVLKQPRD